MDSPLYKLLYSNSIYNNKFKFELAGLSLFVVFILFKYFKSTQFTNVLAVLVIVLFVLYIRTRVYIDTNSDSNQIIDHKLNELQKIMYTYVDERMLRVKYSNNKNILTKAIYKKSLDSVKLSHFYVDSVIIRWCHSILFLYDYNPESFASILMAINNILLFKTQLHDYYKANGYFPDTISFDAQIADKLHKTAVNYLHTFIYTIPRIPQLQHDQLVEKLTIQLYILLKPHITDIKKMAIKRDIQVGVNRTTLFTNINSASSKPIDSQFLESLKPKKTPTITSSRFELYI
jgi:hypothetical protein